MGEALLFGEGTVQPLVVGRSDLPNQPVHDISNQHDLNVKWASLRMMSQLCVMSILFGSEGTSILLSRVDGSRNHQIHDCLTRPGNC